MPFLEFIPWAVLLLIVWLGLGIWITKRPLGKTLIAVGDNAGAVDYAGARRAWVTTRAFVISSLSPRCRPCSLVGYAGVHPSVGRGYEFTAITAVVLGGVVLGGGRGWIVGAVAGAFAPRSTVHAAEHRGHPLDTARCRAGRHHHRRGRLLRRSPSGRGASAGRCPRTPLPKNPRIPETTSSTSTINTETRGD